MIARLHTAIRDSAAPQGAGTHPLVLEKAPLERYVPPEKPSLVGFSRAGLAEMLGAIGVPERERRMRVQQLWHWLYVRGAHDFGAMTSISKELRALFDQHLTLDRPEL